MNATMQAPTEETIYRARVEGATHYSERERAFYRKDGRGGIEVNFLFPAGDLSQWRHDWRVYMPSHSTVIG